MKWILLIFSLSGQPSVLGNVQNYASAQECSGARADALKQFDPEMKKHLHLLCIATPAGR